jgi:hypothetical protein
VEVASIQRSGDDAARGAPLGQKVSVHCAESGGEALVTMVQPGHRRDGDDSAKIARLDRTSDRAIFFEREMRSGTLVVVDIRGHYATQVALVEDNYVVETFAANRTDDPLDVSVLPR